MTPAGTLALVAASSFAIVLVSCYVNRIVYRLGFWDGVLWERERRDGGSYPSCPPPDWVGWESLAKGARQRADACTCPRHRRCPFHGDEDKRGPRP